jgi:hypothetical protein
MAVILVSEDMPGKAYWRCTDCGWESEYFPKHEQRSQPGHQCPRKPAASVTRKEIYFDDIDKG